MLQVSPPEYKPEPESCDYKTQTSGSKEEYLLVVDPFGVGRKSNKYSSTHPQQPMFWFFPYSGQFEAAKLTLFSTTPLQTPTIPRFKRSLLTCGDVQQGCQLSRIWRDSHAFDQLLT